jgi:hypothetical protein
MTGHQQDGADCAEWLFHVKQGDASRGFVSRETWIPLAKCSRVEIL